MKRVCRSSWFIYKYFLKYLEETGVCKLNGLKFDVLTPENVNGFLDWIEDSRGCSINSRNQRLAALKAFSSYVIRKNPEESYICQAILNIRIKKTPQKSVEYLTADSVAYLLKMPDKCTKKGIRDLGILSLMYESGCRVQELIDLKLGGISLRNPNTVNLIGKGNKARVVPISCNVADIIRIYLKMSGRYNNENYVFVNNMANHYRDQV